MGLGCVRGDEETLGGLGLNGGREREESGERERSGFMWGKGEGGGGMVVAMEAFGRALLVMLCALVRTLRMMGGFGRHADDVRKGER